MESVSAWNLILGANISVQFVMIILLVMSLSSWSTFITKYFLIRSNKKSLDYYNRLMSENTSIEKIYKNAIRDEENISVNIVKSGIDATAKENEVLLKCSNYPISTAIDCVERAIEIEYNRSIINISNGLSSLATIASTAPFVGLFGTVLGVMHSFQSISVSNNSSLSVIAPNIAEALLATAMGLFVAIPASIFYNKSSKNLEILSENASILSTKMILILSKSFGRS